MGPGVFDQVPYEDWHEEEKHRKEVGFAQYGK